MAKLYWRIKRNGKWTWRPAEVIYMDVNTSKTLVEMLEEQRVRELDEDNHMSMTLSGNDHKFGLDRLI